MTPKLTASIESPGSDARLAADLQRVDWNFPGSSTFGGSVHTLHWYPGNFIPQIPSFLVQILTRRGELVVDPFCGSGTTGIEALRLGRRVLQADSNRVSALISAAKLAMFGDQNIVGPLRDVAESLLWRLTNPPPCLQGGCGSNAELARWYHPETLEELRAIWRTIQTVKSPSALAVLQMLFSDTLFHVVSPSLQSLRPGRTRRRHHWGWVADNVRPTGLVWQDARSAFVSRIDHALDVCSSIPLSRASLDIATLCRADTRSLPFTDSFVDTVITSPPYLGMIDYSLANRLTYLWFDWPLTDDQTLEIGARYRRNRRHGLSEYLQDMSESINEIHRILKSGGTCAIVVGSSRKFESAASLVISEFSSRMRPIWGPVPRTATRRRVSDRLGSAPCEFVCVFRKD